MKVADIMTAPVPACSLHAHLSTAVELLLQIGCTSIPVLSGADGREAAVMGSISLRAVAAVSLLSGKRLDELRVWQGMTTRARRCTPDVDIRTAKMLMMEDGTDELIVVDEAERLLGMVTIGDLAQAVLRQRDNGRHKSPLTGRDVTDLVAAACVRASRNGNG